MILRCATCKAPMSSDDYFCPMCDGVAERPMTVGSWIALVLVVGAVAAFLTLKAL